MTQIRDTIQTVSFLIRCTPILNQFSFAKGLQNPFRNTSIISFTPQHLYRDIYRYREGIQIIP